MAMKAEEAEAGAARAAVSGRARVRALLIDPLIRDGMVRPRGATVEAHDAFLGKLAERLAYLDDAMLATLAEIVLGLAEGPARNVWPGFASIWNHAVRLCPPPDDERHIMVTWLRSVEGPKAREAGYLVELHRWLRKAGHPPDAWSMGKIREEAAENARQRQRIRERIEAGRATPDDLRWMDWYTDLLRYCCALVAGGERARAEKAESGQ